jgi:hypothetical protein
MVARQNLERKGDTWKIFRNKELAEIFMRMAIGAFGNPRQLKVVTRKVFRNKELMISKSAERITGSHGAPPRWTGTRYTTPLSNYHQGQGAFCDVDHRAM